MLLRDQRFAVTVGLGAVACAIVVLWTPAASPERVIAALLLGFTLPGTAILLLMPARGSGRAEMLLFAVGVSIALLILDSFALYVVGIRLNRVSWAWSLTAITVMCAALSRVNPRRPWVAPSLALAPKGGSTARADTAIVALGAVAAAILLAVAAVITAHSVAHRANSDHFTQLWALPDSAAANSVTVGMFNHEGRPLHYALEVSHDGQLLRSQTVSLPAGGRWSETIRTVSGPLRFSVTSTGQHPVSRWVELRLGER